MTSRRCVNCGNKCTLRNLMYKSLITINIVKRVYPNFQEFFKRKIVFFQSCWKNNVSRYILFCPIQFKIMRVKIVSFHSVLPFIRELFTSQTSTFQLINQHWNFASLILHQLVQNCGCTVYGADCVIVALTLPIFLIFASRFSGKKKLFFYC